MAATAHIRIRPLHRDETAPIDAVFDGVPARSRHRRFPGIRPRSTAPPGREPTCVDDPRRVVLVAEVVEGDDVTAVGVGQFTAIDDEVVEAALAVVDRWQQRGVGRRLLSALRYRAIDLGYRVMVARVVSGHRATAGLLFSVFPDATMRRDGMAYEVTARLPEPVGAVALPLAV